MIEKPLRGEKNPAPQEKFDALLFRQGMEEIKDVQKLVDEIVKIAPRENYNRKESSYSFNGDIKKVYENLTPLSEKFSSSNPLFSTFLDQVILLATQIVTKEGKSDRSRILTRAAFDARDAVKGLQANLIEFQERKDMFKEYVGYISDGDPVMLNAGDVDPLSVIAVVSFLAANISEHIRTLTSLTEMFEEELQK